MKSDNSARAAASHVSQPVTYRSQSRTAAVRDVERARIILEASQGQRVPAIARALCAPTVRLWIKRFNEQGLAGLADAPHRGRPATYTREQIGLVVATALSDPKALAQAFALVRRAGGSRLRRQKGAIEALYASSPEGSVVVCLDEMGPESAKSYPSQQAIDVQARPARWAKQEIDYGRRAKGHVFGAL